MKRARQLRRPSSHRTRRLLLLAAGIGGVALAVHMGCLESHPRPRARVEAQANPRAVDVESIRICYDPHCYCSHPREVLFQYFGDGEMILGHYHAPCAYEDPAELDHYAVQDRCVVLMQRSHDGGRTWPQEDQTVLFDQRLSPERKQAFLFPARARRQTLNMFQPNAVFFFGRTFYPPEHVQTPVCFALRSADRGRTWEDVPTIITSPSGPGVWVHRHAPPVIRMPDGKRLLAVFQAGDPDHPTLAGAEPAIFSSVDNGESWHYMSRPIIERSGAGRFTYAALLLLPGGALHCYTLHIDPDAEAVSGLCNAICLSTSSDDGATWAPPVAITDGRALCWGRPRAGPYELVAGQPTLAGRFYRSPWPIRLHDGRILVIFARRRVPYGIGGIVSADEGRTWSAEFVIQADSAGPDMGYPVGCELEDGQIFVAYYAQADDGNRLGGTRYIAGARFRIETVSDAGAVPR